MLRTAQLALLLLSIGLPRLAADDRIPPWPYRKIEWKARLLGRLQAIELTLTVRDWTLERLAQEISRKTRVTLRADHTLDPRALRVTLDVRRAASLFAILDRLVRGRPYGWTLDSGDVVLTRTPAAYPPADSAAVRRRIEDARFLPRIYRNLRAVERRNERLLLAVARNKISHSALSLGAAAFLARLGELLGLPVELQRGLAPAGAVARPAARDVPIATFLQQTLDPLGLGHTVHRGKLQVGTPAFVALEQRMRKQSRALLQESEAARRLLLERKLSLQARGERLHELAGRLAGALQAEVIADRQAWELAQKITLELKDVTLAEAARAIERQLDDKLSVVVAQGAIYLLAK